MLKQDTFAIRSLVSLHTGANVSSICFGADSSIAARVRVTLVFLLKKKGWHGESIMDICSLRNFSPSRSEKKSRLIS